MKMRCFALIFAAATCLATCLPSLAGMVDITSLGAKSDGSEDVSAIVNANTAKCALFFPAGVYRVSHPLVLKNSIRGDGYSRTPRVNCGNTWLVSDMACTNVDRGVVEFGGDVCVNVENLNIRCSGSECGIRIGNAYGTFAFVDKVGVFDVSSFGLFAKGDGSRRVFANNLTIFGSARNPASSSVGIRVAGIADVRISNIEIMGVCRGLELYNSHTYGDNIHVWTGLMGKLTPEWWHGTRGFVLGAGSHFSGSGIYPDTSYHAFEMGAGSSCEIANLMYWEDGSVKGVKDRTGTFLKAPGGGKHFKFTVAGGMIGVGGDDAMPGATAIYYMPEVSAHDVSIVSKFAIKGSNLDRLCFGSGLPDYTVYYADRGWCKVVDVLAVAETGACAGVLTINDGAVWNIGVKRSASGKMDFAAKPLNSLCGYHEVKMVEEDGVAKVFVRSEDAAPMRVRFSTTYMCDRFRPLDHASLKDRCGAPRYRDVRETLI